MTARLGFTLPRALEAAEPSEMRTGRRDDVAMMVAHRGTGTIEHRRFVDLPEVLEPGDLLVVNTSGTLPAALDGLAPDGTRLVVHLSTRLGPDRWVVEPRRLAGPATQRWAGAPPPRQIALGEGVGLELVAPYRTSPRLWLARLDAPEPIPSWLAANGRPIAYDYVEGSWPIEAYQTVFATEPGSAEMPSAARPFTPELVTRLVSHGIAVTPLVLHTGVASLEADEVPYPERVIVPAPTASRVNATRADGHRVVAVGTTVVRALESAADDSGQVSAFDGWTDLVVTPRRGVRVADGLLTGWHEPEASHLLMLEAAAGRDLLQRSYEQALDHRYRWHEFGDLHLILP